jgi:RNA polymerase sigma-70 factor, ECF subfamily
VPAAAEQSAPPAQIESVCRPDNCRRKGRTAEGGVLKPSFKVDLVSAIPRLRTFAISLVRKPDRADDLVQETLVRAWQNRRHFTEGTNMVAWLTTILRNQFYSEQRRRCRELEDPDRMYAQTLVVSAEQLSHPECRALYDALLKLPNEMRETIFLVTVGGLSYAEVGESLRLRARHDQKPPQPGALAPCGPAGYRDARGLRRRSALTVRCRAGGTGALVACRVIEAERDGSGPQISLRQRCLDDGAMRSFDCNRAVLTLGEVFGQKIAVRRLLQEPLCRIHRVLRTRKIVAPDPVLIVPPDGGGH